MSQRVDVKGVSAGFGQVTEIHTTGKITGIRRVNLFGIDGTNLTIQGADSEINKTFFPRVVSPIERKALTNAKVKVELEHTTVYHDVATGGFTDIKGKIKVVKGQYKGQKLVATANLNRCTKL